MNSTQQNGSALMALRVVYLAMVAGLSAFAIMIFLLSRMNPEPALVYKREILVAVLAVATVSISASGFFWKKKIESIRKMDGLDAKFKAYRSASLARFAMIDFPGLLAGVTFLLTGNIRFLVIIGFVLLAFALAYPSTSRVAKEIEEDEGSIQQL